MQFKFDYKKFQLPPNDVFPQGKLCARPIVPIFLRKDGRSNWIGFEALVDSGADWNIFPAELGDVIGIDIRKGDKLTFSGIGGGNFTAYFHKLTFSIGGTDSGIQYETLCAFSYEFGNKSYGVLGQVGFFDHCVVKFDYSKNRIEVKSI